MADQLTFDFPVQSAFGREDYFVSEPNELAVRMVENWQVWPSSRLLLIGPKGSGKSHLANVWSDLASAKTINSDDLLNYDFRSDVAKNVCVEDCEKLAGNAQLEEAMFHLFNLTNDAQSSLLLTANAWPKFWNLELADLNSRISSVSVAELKTPDDSMLGALLVKQFSDRQLHLDPKVVNYLLPRMERSFETVSELVASLDAWSLQEKRSITVAVAKKVLGDL